MIILIGFAAAALFTLILWRSGGSLTGAAGSTILIGALAMLLFWALGQPWMTDLIQTAVGLRDQLGKSNPRLVIWALAISVLVGLVVKIK
jgi:hypothetical protein